MTETDYSEGDLLVAIAPSATDGEGAVTLRGFLRGHRQDLFLDSPHYKPMLSWLIRKGWTVTVIEKAAPKIVLPTEPGFYLDRAGDVWLLDHQGKMNCLEAPDQNYDPEGWTPFTRLEPENVTAKKVLDAVENIGRIDGDSKINLRHGMKKVAADFGVTS